ncbi:MAG TPA: hypothetical protein ENO21_02515 [Firmicutes bacterium]|nr:hypothetical protein [Bacillota bacterium]
MAFDPPRYRTAQQVVLLVVVLLAIVAVVLIVVAVRGFRSEFSHIDTVMRLSDALEDYKANEGYYPESLKAVEPYVADGGWPKNPYTGLPVRDTFTDVFDSVTSPGNVYYEKHYYPNESAEGRVVIAYRLHSFRKDGQKQSYSGSGGPIENWFDEKEKRTGIR